MIPLHTWNGLVTNILSDTVTRCTMQRIFRYLGTSLVILAAWKSSGVTKVGVIRGGNWRCHPYFFLKKTGDLFSHHYHFYWLHSGVTPPPLKGVTPHLFYLPDLVCPLFFVNLSTNFFFPSGVTPWRVSPGAVRPRLPSDVTAENQHIQAVSFGFRSQLMDFGFTRKCLSTWQHDEIKGYFQENTIIVRCNN